MNVHESEKIAGILQREGYTEALAAQTPNVVVLNTCCVRESAETRILGNLGILKKQKELHPEMKIVVCGCMTQADGAAEKLQKRCPFLHAILGTHNIDVLPSVLQYRGKQTLILISQEAKIVEGTPITRTSGINAWVNIMYGCNNFCSYCIVPYVRGRERSREKSAVLQDVKSLIGQGYKQITLLGQNVNSYGHDLVRRESFAALLSEIASLDGDFRIKFMTSHPKDISCETAKAIAQSEKLGKFVHMPAQAGSDRILQLMNRKYNAAQYLAKVDMLREYMPDVGLSGDIMVGFPTESDADFDDTLRLVESVRYNNLYTFIYSRRRGTPAAAMDGQVPLAEKKKRIRALIDLQFRIGSEAANACIGKTYTVLCSEYKDGNVIGETECGKAVTFAAQAQNIGKFVRVKITDAKNSKLYGVLYQ